MDARLKKLMPPPAKPIIATADVGDWKSLEAQLRLSFPPDFKELVCTYGNGCMDGFLWLRDPFSPGWFEFVMLRLSALYESRAVQAGKSVPYALYPERGGLFPWAFTDNGDTLYWVSDQEQVVIGAGRDPYWDEYKGSLSSFLVALIEHKVSSKVLPRDFPDAPPVGFQAKPPRSWP